MYMTVKIGNTAWTDKIRTETFFKKLNINSATLNSGEYGGRKTNQDPQCCRYSASMSAALFLCVGQLLTIIWSPLLYIGFPDSEVNLNRMRLSKIIGTLSYQLLPQLFLHNLPLQSTKQKQNMTTSSISWNDQFFHRRPARPHDHDVVPHI